MFVAIMSMMKSSEAYKLAVQQLETDERSIAMIGKPLSTGFPMGSIEFSGSNGHASLSFSVEGPNGKGMAYVEATARLGQWALNHLVLAPESSGHRIELTKPSSAPTPDGEDGSLSS